MFAAVGFFFAYKFLGLGKETRSEQKEQDPWGRVWKLGLLWTVIVLYAGFAAIAVGGYVTHGTLRDTDATLREIKGKLDDIAGKFDPALSPKLKSAAAQPESTEIQQLQQISDQLKKIDEDLNRRAPSPNRIAPAKHTAGQE